MNKIWVEPEVRDSVVERLTYLTERTSLDLIYILKIIQLNKTKFYRWKKRTGIPNRHNGKIPKAHWLTPEEIKKIKLYSQEHYSSGSFYLKDGYRRLTYQMIDEDVVAASPSSVYRVLKTEGLLNKWNTGKKNMKGTGFRQPDYVHKHWHVDINM